MEISIRLFRSEDEPAVIDLWRRCGLVVPWNDPHRDIERKLAVGPDQFLVAVEGDVLMGTLMFGYDGHRGWLDYLGVDPQRQGKGIGRQLVEDAVGRLREMGCPKVNLQIRSSNSGVIDFYSRLGFVQDEVVSMGLRLHSDEKVRPTG
ncbi:MAG: GNAT family acetyltransferase [Fimbriimonas sp.]